MLKRSWVFGGWTGWQHPIPVLIFLFHFVIQILMQIMTHWRRISAKFWLRYRKLMSASSLSDASYVLAGRELTMYRLERHMALKVLWWWCWSSYGQLSPALAWNVVSLRRFDVSWTLDLKILSSHLLDKSHVPDPAECFSNCCLFLENLFGHPPNLQLSSMTFLDPNWWSSIILRSLLPLISG